MTTIAILGVGMLGEALLGGLLRSGRSPGDVLVTERRPERVKALEDTYGVRVVSNAEAAAEADVLMLAVKPQDVRALLEECASVISPERLVVSLAAGLTTQTVEGALSPGAPVVRVMTNTPMLVAEAMSAISPGTHAREEHLALTEELLTPVGRTIRVPEAQQDAVTALSGSGPAYFFYLIEAMTDAGILLGLPRQAAHDLLVQTITGAAAMLKQTGERPAVLREAVMSPAGTTITAIRVMEDHGVRAAMLAALEAARDRSRALAAGG